MAALDMDDDSRSLLNKDSKTALKIIKYKDKQNKKTKRTFCEWIFFQPLSKLPFVYFMVGFVGVIALATFHFMDPDTSYILSAAYVALNIFGIKHFYTLIGLKQQVDDFECLNKQFSAEHNKLSGQVYRITEANNRLRESRDRIQAANAKNRENLNQFHGVQETMKTLNLHTIDELQDISDRAFSIGNKWQSQLIERERDMLHTVFDRYELASGKDGMNRGEFNEFSLQLPQSYQQRFARLGTFRKISGNGNVLKFSDFDAALDVFAEMEALDADIEFTIEKTGDDINYNDDRQSTLRFIDDDFDQDFGDISTMKRWKTRRKKYDNIARNVVVHSKDFLSRKAKDFTTSLGILDEENEDNDDEKEKEIDDGFDEEIGYFSGDNLLAESSIRSEGGLGGLARSGSVDEIVNAGRMESEQSKYYQYK